MVSLMSGGAGRWQFAPRAAMGEQPQVKKFKMQAAASSPAISTSPYSLRSDISLLGMDSRRESSPSIASASSTGSINVTRNASAMKPTRIRVAVDVDEGETAEPRDWSSWSSSLTFSRPCSPWEIRLQPQPIRP
jgi:hypothetical protein